MSVLNPDYTDIYTAAGTTGPYPITFDCILDISGNAQDILVQVVDAAGITTDITSTSTITGLNVYTAIAYDATNTIVLVRYPDVTQPYTFPYGTKFPSRTFENALDRLAFLIQRGLGDADLAIKAPIVEEPTPPGRLPTIADRANRFLSFDASGNPIAADAVTGYPVTPFMETVLDDTTAAAAVKTLGAAPNVGYQAISLTNFASAAEPQITTGSKIEVGGVLYEFGSDEAGTGWSGISVGENVFFYIVPSGSSASWEYSTTTPTWSTSKQGWYNGLNRCFGGCTKEAASSYAMKWFAESVQRGSNFLFLPPVSGYTPAVGDVISAYHDGTNVWGRKARRVNSAIVASGSTVLAMRVAALTGTTAVVVYTVGLVCYAVVATIDPYDLSITFGSPATVCTYTTTVGKPDIIDVASDKVLVVYTANGGTYSQLTAVVLSVSGTTITVNTPVNGGAAAYNPAVESITGSSNKVCAYATSTTNLTAVVISISGTTPSFGTASGQTTGTMTSGAHRIALAVAQDGTFAVSVCHTSAEYQTVAWSISGTTITAGSLTSNSDSGPGTSHSPQIFEGPEHIYTFDIGPVGTNTRRPSFLQACKATTTRMSTVTSPALPCLPVYYTAGSSMHRLIDPSTWTYAQVAIVLNGDATQFVQFVLGRMDGSGAFVVARMGDVYVTTIGLSQPNGMCALGKDFVLIAVASGAASTSSLYAVARMNRIVGIAADTLGTVQIAGRVSFLSGLTPGEVGVDINGALSDTVGEVSLGHAITAADLVLSVRQGV